MNGPLTRYTNNFDGLKQLQKSAKKNEGFIYCLKWGDKYFKIGKSKKPYQRYAELKSVAKYGGVSTGDYYVSEPHSNYSENEADLHRMLDNYRFEGIELFDAEIEVIQSAASSLSYEHSDSSDSSEDMPLFLKSTMNRLAKAVGIDLPYPGIDDWAGFTNCGEASEIYLKERDDEV